MVNRSASLIRGISAAQAPPRFTGIIIAAGGSRMTYTVIPFASHSLRSLIIAGPMIEHEIDRMIVGGDAGAAAGR